VQKFTVKKLKQTLRHGDRKMKKARKTKKAENMNPEDLITCDAMRAIERDSENYTVETGGVMIGTLGNPCTIVAAGVSGENSLHHATSFTSDSQADSECLTSAREKYGSGVGVVGWWHKHPDGMGTPSMGDCRQVQLLAGEYNDGKPVLMGIVSKKFSAARHKLSLKLFSLDSKGQLAEHSWQTSGRSKKELLMAISEAPQKPETQDVEFWKTRTFNFI